VPGSLSRFVSDEPGCPGAAAWRGTATATRARTNPMSWPSTARHSCFHATFHDRVPVLAPVFRVFEANRGRGYGWLLRV